MNWRDYANEVELFDIFDKNLEPMSQVDRKKCIKVLTYYFSKNNQCSISSLSKESLERREILRALINTYPIGNIDSDVINLLHRLLISELEERNVVDVNELCEVRDKISIYKGDITTLKTDAIVNPTNSNLIGCLKPLHQCIENAIHSSAGPRLREDCNRIIDKQGHLEYAGNAKITRGYCLPSKFVIHTVGPVVRESNPTKEQEKQLESCYKSCLDIASQIEEIDTIVFPCISTGIFGYPKEQAAKTAVTVVENWLSNNHNKISKVIFNVFSDEDEEMYKNIFGL